VAQQVVRMDCLAPPPRAILHFSAHATLQHDSAAKGAIEHHGAPDIGVRAMSQGKTTRTGSGLVLTVVLFVLFVIALVSFARKVQSSRVSGTVQSSTMGTVASKIAASAIDEAVFLLGERLNGEPEDELYRLVRQETVPKRRSFIQPTATVIRLLAADELTRGYVLVNKGVQVTFLERVQTSLAPWEHRGSVRFCAEVRHPATRIVRRLTRDYTLRLNLLSTPRPFDQFTWAVVEPMNLLDPKANERIDGVLESMRVIRDQVAPTVKSQVESTLKLMNSATQALDSKLGTSHEPYDVNRYTANFERDSFPVPPRFTAQVSDQHHYFDNRIVLFGKESVVPDLSILYLRPRADRANSKVEATRKEYETVLRQYEEKSRRLNELAQSVKNNPLLAIQLKIEFDGWLRTVEQLGTRLREVSNANSEQVKTYVDYTNMAGELTNRNQAFVTALANDLAVDRWKLRSSHRFEGPRAVEELNRFLDRYLRGPEQPKIHGVVYVDNGVTPLTFDSFRKGDGKVRIRGKLNLCATGSVHLTNVVLDDPKTDLFVVCAQGEVKVAGEVHASLVVRGGLIAAPDVKLSGNLVLVESNRPEQLRGRLENRDMRYFSGVSGGFKNEYTYASFGPWATQSSMERE